MVVLVLDEDIDDAFVADLLTEAGFKVVNCQSAAIAGHGGKADAEKPRTYRAELQATRLEGSEVTLHSRSAIIPG